MDNANLTNQSQADQALPGNSFVTTDMPDPEKTRKQLANKRVFFVLLGLIVVVASLIAWEIVDLVL